MVLRYILNGWPSKCPSEDIRLYYSRKNELCSQYGCILWGRRVIIPQPGREAMLSELHQGHRMKSLGRSYIWWPGMVNDLELTVVNCYSCQENQKLPVEAPLHPWEYPSHLWSRLHIDFAGPFMNKSFLIMVDAYSKWIDIHVMNSTTSEATIAKLQQTFATHGLCDLIISDNGAAFTSKEFADYVKSNGIEHRTSAPWHPASNGCAERAVQSFKEGMKKIKEGTVQEKLNRFLFNYCITPQTKTGLAPSELLMKRKLKSRLDLFFPNIEKRVQERQQKQKHYHNKKSVNRQINIGQGVFARNFAIGSKIKWIQGEVIKQSGPLSFHIKLPDGHVIPICDGKTNLTGACNMIYQEEDCQITRKETICNSGGNCLSPEVCSNCNEGFYSEGPYCRKCGTIDHCKYTRCTTSSNQHCEWCEAEIFPMRYWRAYIRHFDKTKCQQACSWKTDSTRCFPGNCIDELASQCTCADNFSGHHCENIDNTPTIEYNHCKFSDNGRHNILENDPNWNTTGHPTTWTNFIRYTKVSVVQTARYLQPRVNITQHYVKNYSIGVIEERVTLSYYKGSTFNSKQTQTCSGMNRGKPVSFKQCNFTFAISTWSFTHNDRVVAEFSSTNGGYVIVANRDIMPNDSVTKTYYYSGKTLTRHFEYHWDLENPYHCSNLSGVSCTPFLELSEDVTENPNLSFWWGGWSDDLSGLDHYEYDLYYLQANRVDDDAVLIDGAGKVLVSKDSIPINESSGYLHLTVSGMYSLHLVAFDKAGNYKLGRNLFLYDNQSIVEIQENKPQTHCSTASKDTLYSWVTIDTKQVKIDWKDRFINVQHNDKKWLNPVKTYAPNYTKIYEDLYGDRKNVRIKNVNAIVDFQVSYEVDSVDTVSLRKKRSLKDSRPFTSVSDINNQYDVLTLVWADGDRLTATVKAIDVLNKTNEETIKVYRDATPPIIENLWMTKGDRLNISVHSLEDFTKMTIEWEAYDIHSGLDSVYWRLYDSMTDVLHGHEDVIAQGHATNLSHCEDKYSQYPRGANCYCTPFHGCFHRHFQIKPEIKEHGGLIANKDSGTHEYDYFIEISVTSIANLTTVLTRKVGFLSIVA
ncbi:unnamed protein product [Mytilus coruscus]|uniref:Integrase catalytic domain-containing protein n=1 Tax=Mytilus coruscus TaxID=42192 RepID=A0A6J8AR81_MYTCO|nr:unnamed protein product [Mytilus coruscus]